MREEIDAAVHFFGRVIVASNSAINNLHEFKSCLSKLLEKRFEGHWHVEVPGKGQGYRSIRIHPSEPLDPVLERAAHDSDFNYHNFFIPMEFTLWVDPKDVSCRFGDLKATYCTVLKDQDNKSNSIDVEELLETAKAVYNRQQQISIQQSNKQVLQPSYVMDIYQYERNAHYPSGSPPLYYDGFHPHNHHHHPGSNYLLYGAGGDGFSTPPPPFTSPPSPPQFQPSFLSSAVNTTPRKGNGKGGNFRKNGGGNGTGRGSRHNHHHQQQHNGEGSTYNHNHNNNHNTNGSTPNGTNWNGDRYHWVKGAKQQQQQQQNSGSGKDAK